MCSPLTWTTSFTLFSLTFLHVVVAESTSLIPNSNCTTNERICRSACNEQSKLAYSATYCDAESGNCICDCRDKLRSKCTFTPFTPCYTYCVSRNPNPDFFLYVGGVCPIMVHNSLNRTPSVLNQCACQCSIRGQQNLMDNEIS